MNRLRTILTAVAICLSPAVLALAPSERLPDAGQEARARELSAELRCLVCQNQSIDDSDAPLAKDLRKLVRERIAAGDSDAQVKSFLVGRYGEFVLLKPSFSAQNALLWLLPFLALFGGMIAARRMFSRPEQKAEAPLVNDLTSEEQAELDRLTGNKS